MFKTFIFAGWTAAIAMVCLIVMQVLMPPPIKSAFALDIPMAADAALDPPEENGVFRTDFVPQPGQFEIVPMPPNKIAEMVNAARAQIGVTLEYDPIYRVIKYPNGDVPMVTGVCADVVVRAVRAVGVDLQRIVHEDMKTNFGVYPQRWGLNAPDTNIDHRRVPNLMTFFERQGKAVEITKDPADYQPGDIVSWQATSGSYHIGLISNIRMLTSGRYLIIHNVGNGTMIQDRLFEWEIVGHYRLFKANQKSPNKSIRKSDKQEKKSDNKPTTKPTTKPKSNTNAKAETRVSKTTER